MRILIVEDEPDLLDALKNSCKAAVIVWMPAATGLMRSITCKWQATTP